MRGGSSVGQTGLLLGDSLFSKELENMGKQLAGRQLCVCVGGQSLYGVHIHLLRLCTYMSLSVYDFND